MTSSNSSQSTRPVGPELWEELLVLSRFTCKAKTKKLSGSGNPTLPTILVPTLIFFFVL